MFRYNITSKLFIKNIIGNILLFMPFGLFVTAYLDVRYVTPTVILTLISQISIEVVQKLIGRVFDVDDIILNVIGGFVGSVIFIMLDKLRDKLPKVLNKDWFMNLIFIIVLLALIVYFTNFAEYINEMVR